MARKRKSKSGNGLDQYRITQWNLDKKGKTNKKLRSNPQASKWLTPQGQEIKDAAAEYAKAHPVGSGRRYKKKISEPAS